jgi:hypothetical protein
MSKRFFDIALVEGVRSRWCEVAPSFAGRSAFGEPLSNVGGDGDGGVAKLVGESEKFAVGRRFGEAIDSQNELVGAAPNF